MTFRIWSQQLSSPDASDASMTADTNDGGDLDECPYCNQSWDDIGDQPALEEVGHNPKSGTLYTCHVCLQRVTEDELETGRKTTELVAEGYYE